VPALASNGAVFSRCGALFPHHAVDNAHLIVIDQRRGRYVRRTRSGHHSADGRRPDGSRHAGPDDGEIITAKLLLVAALLGGFNRLVVMPPWLADHAGRPALSLRFKRILWIEAAV
jgi:hypothetical protein